MALRTGASPVEACIHAKEADLGTQLLSFKVALEALGKLCIGPVRLDLISVLSKTGRPRPRIGDRVRKRSSA